MSKRNNISDHSECFPEEILLKYINDELNSQDSEAVEQHISHCPICSDFIDGVMMLESTDDFLAAKEDINRTISASLNKEKKRKFSPFMIRAVAAVALILIFSGSYFLINSLLDKKELSQFENEDKIVQNIPEKEKTCQEEIAQTINIEEESKDKEIIEDKDFGVLDDVIDETRNLCTKDTEVDGAVIYETINNQSDAEQLSGEITISTTDISVGDSSGKKSEASVDYNKNRSTVFPEEIISDSEHLYGNDQQTPTLEEQVSVKTERDDDLSISDRENFKPERSEGGLNARTISKEKEDEKVKDIDIVYKRDEITDNADSEYYNDISGLAPTGITSGRELETSDIKSVSFANIEEKPIFPGGYEELIKFVDENIKYPEMEETRNRKEEVVVSFIIDTAGYVTNVNVLRGVNPKYDLEAIRVIEMLPRWTPGKVNGKPVNVSFVYPIEFNPQ